MARSSAAAPVEGKARRPRKDLRRMFALSEWRRKGIRGRRFDRLRAARWRVKEGLEHRTLVALLHAPEVLAEARSVVGPADFLSPPYAALAAVVLAADSRNAIEVARASVVGRPYLPHPDYFDWKSEARALVALMIERRARWAARRTG